MTITETQVREVLHEIIAEHPGWKTKEPAYATQWGEPICVVAQVLYRLGFPLPEHGTFMNVTPLRYMREKPKKNNFDGFLHRNEIEFETSARRLLSLAQRIQDGDPVPDLGLVAQREEGAWSMYWKNVPRRWDTILLLLDS